MELNEDNKWEWVGTIETSMGNYVDILNLQPHMVELNDIATSLSNICRFNGHLPSFYSVAEHSVRVSWWLADMGFSKEIALTGLLHDAAEAYVGDMMRPLKRVPEMEAVFKPIEDHAIEVIHSVLGGKYPHPYIIGIADKETYEWEAENIRTAKTTGWSADFAHEMFLASYYQLTNNPERLDTSYQSDTDDDVPLLISAEEMLAAINMLDDDPTAAYENAVNDSHITPRRSLLNMAADLVDGDRNAQYGDPIDDFKRTSIYWSTHIGGVLRRKAHSLGYEYDEHLYYLIDNLLDPHDVAIMMGQLKDSRLAWDPYKHDTWADKAGYSACGYDCVVRDN